MQFKIKCNFTSKMIILKIVFKIIVKFISTFKLKTLLAQHSFTIAKKCVIFTVLSYEVEISTSSHGDAEICT